VVENTSTFNNHAQTQAERIKNTQLHLTLKMQKI